MADFNYSYLRRSAAPGVLPVTLGEAKTHLRVLHSADDDYISALLQFAVDHVEEYTRRALINQTWEMGLDALPDGNYIYLPVAPVTAISSFVYDGLTWAAASYTLNKYNLPARIWPVSTWPSVSGDPNCIVITFTTGYGAAGSSVPAELKHAIKLLITHLYDNRAPYAMGAYLPKELPIAYEALIRDFRVWV